MTYRVAGYARVSTLKDEQLSSITHQREMFDVYVNEKGWKLEKLYVERVSGTKAKRPKLIQLIDDITENRIDVVIVKDLSRLARNGELSYRISNLMKEKGVHIISLDGMVNSLEDNMDMLGMFAWLYEMESENTSSKIKSTLRHNASKGKYKGSVPPYGYKLNCCKLYIKGDETTENVKWIFGEYLKGIGPDTIAKELTLKEVPTPSQVNGRKGAGVKWHGSTIKAILINQHYIGNLEQGKTTTISVVSTKRKVNDKNDREIVENTHDAIISKEDFKSVQKLMSSKQQHKAAPKRHLFSNITFCADCGTGMWTRPDRQGYICGKHGRYGNKLCSSHLVKEEKLLKAITDDFEEYMECFNSTKLLQHLKNKIKKALTRSNNKLEKVEGRIQALKKRRVTYSKLLADEDMDIDTYKLSIGENNKELDELKRKQKDLIEENHAKEIDLTKINEEFKQYIFSKEIISEIIHRFVARIDVEADGTARIHYNFQEPEKIKEVS